MYNPIWLDNDGNIRIDMEIIKTDEDALDELKAVCPYCASETDATDIQIDFIGGTQYFYYYCYVCDNDFHRRFDLTERED